MFRKLTAWYGAFVELAATYLSYVAAALLAVMMFFTALDVILRYFLNRPITGSYEISEFMMAIVISFAVAYCGAKRGHISVDILVGRLPKRVRAVLDSVLSLINLAFIGLVAGETIKHVTVLRQTNSKSSVVGLSHWPFVVAVAIGLIVLVLVILRDLIADLRLAITGVGEEQNMTEAGEGI